jgi:hypothetical protein
MFNFFKKNHQTQEDTTKSIISKDELFVELSDRFISYYLNNDLIQTVDLPIQEQYDFAKQLKIWNETLKIIIQTLKATPSITIYLKSSKFIIKNSDKALTKNSRYNYFATKMALEEDNIEVLPLFNTSYLILEYQFLRDILFAFKDYNIKNIYDTSLVNSFIVSSDKNSLYIDISMGSFFIILNRITIQKRNLNNNLSQLINACASSLYLDFETSYKNIQSNFNHLTTYNELENSTKPLQKNIKEFIDNIIEDIKNTLSYFSILDNVEYIENIYINGDILEFDFIIKILSSKLDVNFIPLNQYAKTNTISKTNLTLSKTLSKDIYDKLHLVFDGLNYNDGRDEYIFVENRFLSKGTLTSSQKSHINATTRKVKLEHNKNNIDDIDAKPFWKMDIKELFAFIKTKSLNPQKQNQFNLKLIPYLIAGIVLSFVLFIVFNFVSEATNDFENNINILEDRIKRVDKLKKKLVQKNEQLIFNNINEQIDKIFWTQKIITLANLMPNAIWLSSISMENQTKTIEDKEITNQIMTLEARALPSTIGHIANIANYMHSLLNADDNFRKDFSSISFGGATIVNEYGYDVVNFKLLCNFEKNINIQDIKLKQKSIKQNLVDINKNSKIKQQMLNKL